MRNEYASSKLPRNDAVESSHGLRNASRRNDDARNARLVLTNSVWRHAWNAWILVNAKHSLSNVHARWTTNTTLDGNGISPTVLATSLGANASSAATTVRVYSRIKLVPKSDLYFIKRSGNAEL